MVLKFSIIFLTLCNLCFLDYTRFQREKSVKKNFKERIGGFYDDRKETSRRGRT